MDCARHWVLAVTAWLLIIPGMVAGDEPGQPTLRLRNGGYVLGRLQPSDDAAEIVWQGRGFSRPLRFPLANVHSIQYPQPAAPVRSMGPYSFELPGGDTLNGQLISLDEKEVVLEIPAIGKISIARSALRRFYQIGAADLIFSGPNGLDGWTKSGVECDWLDDRGQLSSDVTGAVIGRKDRPPPAVRYEIELAWTGKGKPDFEVVAKELPDFELVAGLSQHADGRTAFRLETWGDELVILRESDTQADFAVLQKIQSGSGEAVFSVMFEEALGRLLVYSATGAQVADFTVPLDKGPPKPPVKRQVLIRGMPAPEPKPETPFGLQLINRRGNVTLRQLTIRRWSGITPQPASATEAIIHVSEGGSQTAEIRRFDTEARQLVIEKDGKEQRIDERLLQDVILVRGEEPGQRPVSVLLKDGARISGELKQIAAETLVLLSPVIKDPLSLPLKEVQAMEVPGLAVAIEDKAAWPVRLEMSGVSLRGTLKEGTQGEDSCLVFQPSSSTTASPLAANASGKLIFRDPVQEPKPQPRPQSNRIEAGGAGVIFFNGIRTTRTGVRSNEAPTLKPKPPGECLLHLRSGDTLACLVQSIDERGVTIKSDVAAAEFVPHDRIKAVELRLDATPVKIEKARFERLLTLPRMQRDNPPLHLIRSLQGDYLRGRLISMNDKDLEIEMRLDSRKIARDQVTRILWLHPDEQAKAAVAKPDEASEPKPPAGIRVQAVPRSGNRLTFFAQEFAGNRLSGQSEILGACQVELDQMDQLLVGAAIEEAAATLAFHQWRLRPAAEPLPEPDPSADPGSEDGMESVLVGKPAPPIELDLLAGGKFRLEDFKDKVVVLDFWASWCGPCLQAMPQVDKVAAEFSEQGVKLIAINLEETPEKIKTALTRLGLATTVALDKDGRIAERYGASDIPQTVIIGRDGKVARLFVGAGSRFDERLRQALKAVLEK